MGYYGSLCTQMYELDKPYAPEEELSFYMSYAKCKDMKILEPMCGSGRFFLPFVEQGFHIDGFDISKDMLEVCRAKCDKKGLGANLQNVSMEGFSTDEKYDLIMMPGGSFTLLIDDGVVSSSLTKLRDILRPEGTLLIEVLTPVAKVDKSDN
ncbi:MAG: class I SAM-dependent methyltransferase [Clostridia bacterium]